MKPRLLDLFCGAGGAAMGYHRAGFDVVGVDIVPQPHYPFEFVQADALGVLAALVEHRECEPVGFVAHEPARNVNEGVMDEHLKFDGRSVGFERDGDGVCGHVRQHDRRLWDVKWDVIHASPPCQAYSVANNVWKHDHPDLLPTTRELLESSGVPWVIENVPGAPMYLGPASLFEPDRYGVLICGRALGLNVKRHRLFESNRPLIGTQCPPNHPGDWLLVFGHTVLERGHVIRKTPAGHSTTRRKHTTTARGREAMGIDWMNRDELSEAIPPAYTEFIGEQLLASLERVA